LQQGLSLKEKEYWESSRNFVKCTGQQIKQPEAGCSLLETRFATSSKNHAGCFQKEKSSRRKRQQQQPHNPN